MQSAVFALTVCSVVLVSIVGLRLPVTKHNMMKPFKPADPVRNFVDYLSTSISKVFDFGHTPEVHMEFHPTMMKSSYISDLRKAHRTNAWEADDLAKAFAQHFLLDTTPPAIRNAAYTPDGCDDICQVYVSHDNDPADYLAHGVLQAFSTMKSSNAPPSQKTLPPFRRSSMKMSKLRKMRRRSGFKYAY